MQKILIPLLMCVALAACAYKPDIQQGNMVTLDKVNRLQIGMEKRQVLFIMGSPMLTDAFHRARWDYYYSFTPGRQETVRHRVTVHFDGERVTRIDREGDIPATEYPEPSPDDKP